MAEKNGANEPSISQFNLSSPQSSMLMKLNLENHLDKLLLIARYHLSPSLV